MPKCDTCGFVHASPYYFRTADLCLTCFAALREDQRASVARDNPVSLAEVDKRPPISEKELEEWTEMTRMGRLRFILERGVFNWGVSSAFIWSALMSALDSRPFMHYLGRAIITFPIGGAVWGLMMWEAKKRRVMRGK